MIHLLPCIPVTWRVILQITMPLQLNYGAVSQKSAKIYGVDPGKFIRPTV